MLPIIAPEFTVDSLYQDYLIALEKTDFSGSIRSDYAARLAVATDNSIYQVIPQAVILPKTTADVAIALQLGSEERFRAIKFSPRGGGVGANGQSLSSSIIIDCSKYMRNIIELNVQERWVRVQPGVVQDQLNQYLLTDGLHFAPEISPSNRATLGGMINTDACGNGQKIIGRTSDHVLELTGVLADGTIFSSINSHLQLFENIAELLADSQTIIAEKFPKTPRTYAGYNLLKASREKFNLNYLLCGSEGTLAVITECKLKLTRLPKYKALMVVQYRFFDDALAALNITENIKPLVIECIDERLLNLARNDAIYFYVKDFIEHAFYQTGAINLVEFIADDKKSLQEQIDLLCSSIDLHKNKDHYALGYYVATDPLAIKYLWELRKKSVGLISKNKVGTRRPIPFIEDTAVSPEHLVAYINDLKTLLNKHQLEYGMYGHVDAGCVHVRPALDLQLLGDEQLHQQLSHDVVTLLQKYNGVMWGEHGMGFRAQFSKTFFGEEIYAIVRRIKTEFDPYNKLNPGKVVIPFDCDEQLVMLSGPLRAQFDKQIPQDWQNKYSSAMVCNGNGACFNYATQETMCPSFKVTKDRVHSPKGRAAVVREWLRQLKKTNYSFSRSNKLVTVVKKIFSRKNADDFAHEIYAAIDGCLGCKACAAQCPLNVNIPELKANFLSLYYQRYFRPLRDYLISSVETIVQYQAFFPRFSRAVLQSKWAKILFKKCFGLVDLPVISLINVRNELRKRNVLLANVQILKTLSMAEKEKSIILLQDVFTRYYRPEILLAACDLFKALGFTVYLVPFFINGKPYQVKGFLAKFHGLVRRNIKYLNSLADLDIAMVGLEPSITLTYRDEYAKLAESNPVKFQILLPQEWLVKHLVNVKNVAPEKKYYLLTHCSEKAVCIAAEKQWVKVFSAFGLNLQPLSAGCCGMAGSYGLEEEHALLSLQLFKMDWLSYLQANKDIAILATGFSCVSQAQRFYGATLLHPIEVLSANFK